MAEVKTLKFGEVVLLEEGGRQRLYNETGVTEVTGCYSGGEWQTFAVNSSGDLTRKTSAHPLTVAYTGSGTTVYNPSQPMAAPVVWEHDGTIHLWFACDFAGGSAYDLWYQYSDDDGATWSGLSLIESNGGASWYNSAIYPVGFVYNADDESANTLYCIGYNGSAYQLGKFTVDGTVTDWKTSLAGSAQYSAYGSNPVGPPAANFGTRRVTVFEHRKKLHLICGNAAAPTKAYHSDGGDGTSWTRHDSEVVFRRGVTGSRDETSVHPCGAAIFQGNVYLYYIGFEGATSSPMLAVGSNPEHLVKVGGIESPQSYTLAPFSGDVSFTSTDDVIHIPDRGDPGILRQGPFEPYPVSFSALFFGTGGSDGTTASGEAPTNSDEFWKYLQLKSPAVGASTGYTPAGKTFNLLYRSDSDTAGTQDEFHLFLECTASPSIEDREDANSVTVSLLSHGSRHPISGRY